MTLARDNYSETEFNKLTGTLPRTVGDLITEQANKFGEKVFLYFKNEKVTYKQLNENVNRIANGFLDLGVNQGDRVCLMLPNCPEFIYSWFASAKVGAIEVPINTAYKGTFLSYILNNSQARFLVVHRQFQDRLAFIKDDLERLECVIVVGEGDEQPIEGLKMKKLNDLLKSKATEPPVNVEKKDLVAIMYTSGTTGPAKGVMMTHNYYCLMGRDNAFYRRLLPEDITYTCLPFFHANAQCLTTVPVLTMGASLALGEKFSASNFWDELISYNANQFNGIGAMMSILWRQPPSEKEKQHKVSVCFAAPIPPEVFNGAQDRWGIKCLEGFGLSESGLIAYQPWNDMRVGSFGKQLPSYEVRIVDDFDEEVASNEIGEIVSRPLRSHTMMEGYFNMPEKTLESFRNLWFHTGDYGKRDEDGYLYFVDRKKDAIRRRGENISSFEVEAAFNQHPAVQTTAAISVPSELSEDEVKITVVLKPDMKITEQELIDWSKERVPSFMVPRYVEFVSELPITPTERIEKYKLRQNAINKHTWDVTEGKYCLEG